MIFGFLRNAHLHVARRAVQTVWRFGLLPSAQRAACTGAMRSASVLGRFDLLVSVQRAAGPARCVA
ncbi:hypothetical protein A2U01_0065614 [Trifolium medium]|uniref:Uncharacterized protein n=1 Tax=Trifolium medium TaxID=97028 RepID=A0A392S902_9FABA|nr:hypothetical protein [Trifolium medium]